MKNIFQNRLTKTLFILIFILSFTAAIVPNNSVLAEVSVHFIDVGQGDSILIQHEEHNMLIDGGDRWNRVADKLVRYLNQQDVDMVDVMVSTHPHADHIGGLDDVIMNFEVAQVYGSGRVHTTQTYENYLELIDEKDIPFDTPRRGDTIKLGELEFKVFHPSGEIDVDEYSLNNASVVLQLEYGEISFLFSGDAEYRAEKEIVEDTDYEIDSTVLKVPHHGSSTSTNDFFLKEVNPQSAVIMAGEDNRFGHPDGEVLEALESEGVDIYRTDLHGDIVMTTDGFDYEVEVSKESEPRAPPEETAEPAADKININTASAIELQKLHGIGPAYAENIIEYREEQGGFDTIEEIKEVSGIGPATFDNIKEEITI